jgi:hypothetical protein
VVRRRSPAGPAGRSWRSIPLPDRGPDRPKVVTAALSVNRRQVDPDERAALVAYRAGHIDYSQTIRHQRDWEHNPGHGEAARQAMADAVAADVARHGSGQVVALAVTHADCEDIADRLRGKLIEGSRIGGAALEGPGWRGPRSYQAGDRIVLHAHLRVSDGARLTNGTTATVVAAGPDGLIVTVDSREEWSTVPAAFFQERSSGGRPRQSHAWCRTIDGVQGGTWAQVHLLATLALDNYRGYVGQSRSVQPTHTWNTIPTPDPDHGGRLVTEPGPPGRAGLRRSPQSPAQNLRRRGRLPADQPSPPTTDRRASTSPSPAPRPPPRSRRRPGLLPASRDRARRRPQR